LLISEIGWSWQMNLNAINNILSIVIHQKPFPHYLFGYKLTYLCPFEGTVLEFGRLREEISLVKKRYDALRDNRNRIEACRQVEGDKRDLFYNHMVEALKLSPIKFRRQARQYLRGWRRAAAEGSEPERAEEDQGI
jgi:hypothetical protein